MTPGPTGTASGTVRTVAEVELWTALVKAAFGALGLAVLAIAPLAPTPAEFPALRAYVFVTGAVLLLWAASSRHRPLLALLGLIALAAGLTASIVGDGQPMASRAALALDSGAAVLLGAVARRPYMAVPFLLVPLLIVAAGPPGWGPGHQEFAEAWTAALGCECLWPGVPASLAIVGAAIGDATARPWPAVRPSAVLLVVGCLGLVMAGLVLWSIAPAAWDLARLVLARLALLAGILAWIAVAYQAGRPLFVVESGMVGLLVLVGRLYADAAIRYPGSFDLTLLATVLASLVPAVLAGLGLLVRQWIGTERPDASGLPPGMSGFFREDEKGTYTEHEPLITGGLGPRDRPDEAGTSGGSERGSPGKGL